LGEIVYFSVINIKKMAISIPEPRSIFAVLKRIDFDKNIFCFFSFDKRKRFEKFRIYLSENGEWIDELSYDSGVITFIYSNHVEIPGLPYFYESAQRYMKEGKESIFSDLEVEVAALRDPSVEIAEMIGVTRDKLPGLIIFQLNENKEIGKNFIFIELLEIAEISVSDFEKYLLRVYSTIRIVNARFPSEIRFEELQKRYGDLQYLKTDNKQAEPDTVKNDYQKNCKIDFLNLKKILSNGDIQEVISRLTVVLQEIGGEFHNLLIIISTRFEKLETDYLIKETLKYEEYTIYRNKVNAGLVRLIDNIERSQI